MAFGIREWQKPPATVVFPIPERRSLLMDIPDIAKLPPGKQMIVRIECTEKVLAALMIKLSELAFDTGLRPDSLLWREKGKSDATRE
jgi:hypothetical protein